jgi:hypothetical protein
MTSVVQARGSRVASRPDPWRVLAIAVGGSLGGSLLNFAIAALASANGVEFRAPLPPPDGPVSVISPIAFGLLTLLPVAIGTVAVWALARRDRRWATAVIVLGIGFTALSLGVPLSLSLDPIATAVLILGHLIAGTTFVLAARSAIRE